MPKHLIDHVYERIQSEQVQEGMEDLINGLREIRLKSTPEAWKRMVQDVMLAHPITEMIHSDPFTRWSFYKPRGYSGDAALLDMIYFHPAAKLENGNRIGSQIYEYTINAPACQAVRFRRQYLAHLIDQVSAAKPKAKIMSVACGHLREIELSQAAGNGGFGAFVALDQDGQSIAVVENDYRKLGVKAITGSIRDIIRKKLNFSGFDLIYAAGLYDYLEPKVGGKLTLRLFDLLAPGGTLLIANFLPAVKDIGYMESYMDWHLIFRAEPEMVALAQSLPRKQIEKMEIFSEPQENIVFFKVGRAN